MERKTVVVAMSGGVDSSVAAARALELGYEASGVTLKLLPRMDSGFGCCGSPEEIEDARRVCEKLGIAHYTLNLWELFDQKVIRPFIDSYLNAETPNPCVECNRHLKFGHLLDLARAWEVDYLATGHYARVQELDGEHRLLRAIDAGKDQSYVLYGFATEALSSVIFPLGELTKPEVRQMARRLELAVADKPDSQEICFVPRRDYRGFVASRAVALPSEDKSALASGPIVDRSGKVLGRHGGLAQYTMGQRSGLGIALGKPVYVVELDVERNALVIGEAPEAYGKSFKVREINWLAQVRKIPATVQVKIRYRSSPVEACLRILDDPSLAEVSLAEPQWAPTPGQSAVFYDGERVLGGGIISR